MELPNVFIPFEIYTLPVDDIAKIFHRGSVIHF